MSQSDALQAREHARPPDDPLLVEREQQYRAIFEATSDGLIINDIETGTIVEANPAACRMHGYSYDEFVGRSPLDIIHPDDHHLFAEFIRAIRAGEQFRGRSTDVRKDGSLLYVEVVGRSFTFRGKPHVMAVLRDVTQHVETRRLLEQRVEERTRELATLLEVSHSVASTLELGPLLTLILEQLKSVADYTGTSILSLHGDALTILEAGGVNITAERRIRGLRFDVRRAGPLWETLSRREPVIIDDIRSEDGFAPTYRAIIGENLELPGFRYIRSWLGVPLALRDRVIGLISLSHHTPGFYTESHATLAKAIANHAALAIENARLFAEAEQRSRELAALFRADEMLHRSLRVNDVLQALADVAVDILQADTTSVLIWDAPHDRLVMGATRGFSEASLALLAQGQRTGITWHVAQSGLPIAVEDVQKDDRVMRSLTDPEGLRSLLHVPITVDGEVFGVFGVNYRRPRRFTGQEERLLLALASRAALAIENARLFEQVQGKAALEERQRLARELHDSVSQALFSIALGARTARTLLDRDPSQVAQPLDYVLSLADAGLAEMRALIFELRPESLENEGLLAALQKHAAALKARHAIETELDLSDEPTVPMPVKEALYRIAQEALHNVVKHARAGTVTLRLAMGADRLTLEIGDDGVGFDPAGEFPGHLGLHSMRERLAALGGSLEIESTPGQGARIRATVPLHPTAG